MTGHPREPDANDQPEPRGWPRGRLLALGLPAGVAFGLLTAWASAAIGQWRAPLVFFPLATGAVIGMCLAAAIRMVRLDDRRWAAAAVVLVVVVVVVGQHYFGYLAVCRHMDDQAELFVRARETFGEAVEGRVPSRPTGLIDFLRSEAARGRRIETSLGAWTARGGMAWLSWAVDGLLVLLPAAALVAGALRRKDRSRDG